MGKADSRTLFLDLCSIKWEVRLLSRWFRKLQYERGCPGLSREVVGNYEYVLLIYICETPLPPPHPSPLPQRASGACEAMLPEYTCLGA